MSMIDQTRLVPGGQREGSAAAATLGRFLDELSTVRLSLVACHGCGPLKRDGPEGSVPGILHLHDDAVQKA